jgi:hypothetical protein
MGVAFELEVTRSRNEACWVLAIAVPPVAGLGLVAFRILSGPTVLLDAQPMWALPAVVACLAAGVLAAMVPVAAWLRRARSSRTRLVVDDAGGASLRLDDAPAVPFSLASTGALPGLTLLVMAPYPPRPSRRARGRSVTLMIGRDSSPAEDWRRLQVWLRWLERGRSLRPEAGSDQT